MICQLFGDLLFFARPTLGGSRVLRGYIAGRWRDDAAWAAATEHRVWVIPRGFPIWRYIRIERLGLALFYEVGGVAENGFEFFQERVRQSYGSAVVSRCSVQPSFAPISDFRKTGSMSQQASACPFEWAMPA